jgi:enoyl-CoA hydratase/carnithine racemase
VAESAHDVTVEIEGHVAIVTLVRPPHNLLTEATLGRVADALDGLDGKVEAAVVASEGRSFCAGADFRSADAPDPTNSKDFERLGAIAGAARASNGSRGRESRRCVPHRAKRVRIFRQREFCPCRRR